MKIYIETDLEGISGIVSRKQAWDIESREYLEQSRYYLMKEVNAAIDSVYEMGADYVIVNDCHKFGFNMILEEMDPRPEYIQGGPRNKLLYGLDETFDAMILIGFHAMAGTSPALFDHTMNANEWMNYWINGIKMGEIGQLCVMAGYYDVPVIFVSGDQAAADEAKELLGEVETVAVKKAFSRHGAQLLHPATARKLIQEGIKKAMSNIKCFKPYKISLPAEIKVELMNTELAQMLEERGVTRIDSKTVIRTVNRIEDIVRL